MPASRRDPSPAMLRNVSGRNSTIATTVTPERTKRKTNIERKLRNFVSIPPITGPPRDTEVADRLVETHETASFRRRRHVLDNPVSDADCRRGARGLQRSEE